MYDPETHAYVCRQAPLVRRVPVAAVPPPLDVRPPLRVLGVISSPLGLPSLDVEKEQGELTRALERAVESGLVEVHWALDATWAGLQEILLREQWHVLHFIGHGDFNAAEGEGQLALVRNDGRPDLVGAPRLVDLLQQARPMPRLVVLNTCSSAATGADDLFSGIAAALVRGGVSAVAAMQYEISDPAAAAFARGFYTAIACGRGVDDALSSGRVGIIGLSGRTLEWVSPVLYLRGNDSHLFRLPTPAEGDSGKNVDSVSRDPVRELEPEPQRAPALAAPEWGGPVEAEPDEPAEVDWPASRPAPQGGGLVEAEVDWPAAQETPQWGGPVEAEPAEVDWRPPQPAPPQWGTAIGQAAQFSSLVEDEVDWPAAQETPQWGDPVEAEPDEPGWRAPQSALPQWGAVLEQPPQWAGPVEAEPAEVDWPATLQMPLSAALNPRQLFTAIVEYIIVHRLKPDEPTDPESE
jgi:hypothetical protein